MRMKKQEKTTTSKKAGIYFCGIVAERRRRMVPKDDPQNEVITYTIYDEESHMTYYVDDFQPEEYFEKGEYIEVPVRIKAYVHKGTGKPAYSMTIKRTFEQSDISKNGEVF